MNLSIAGGILATAGTASAIALQTVSTAPLGVPVSVWAASFFGAIFGMLYLPSPEGDTARKSWLRQVIGLPALTAVGAILAGMVGELTQLKPVYLNGVGLVIAAAPVPVVRAVVDWITRKFGGAP